MWSHYANKHEGLCIGFDFSPIMPNDYLQFGYVNYEANVIYKNYFSEQLLALYRWVFTKSKDWEYEEEIRVPNIKGNGLFQIDPSCVKELYFGLRTSEKLKEKNMRPEAFKKYLETP